MSNSSTAKKLDQLQAGKAGVSKGELAEAFEAVDGLKAELAEADATLAVALEAKEKAAVALQEAKEKAKAASEARDPIYQEWQRADWIVRNSDPDQPTPPMGQAGPRVIAKRGN